MDESTVNLVVGIGVSVALMIPVLWFLGLSDDDNDDDWSDRAW